MVRCDHSFMRHCAHFWVSDSTLADGVPLAKAIDHGELEQPEDSFDLDVVAAISDASDQDVDADFGQLVEVGITSSKGSNCPKLDGIGDYIEYPTLFKPT